MQKERKDQSFIKKPVYPGGLKAMRAFIGKELQYPKEALEEKIEGTVFIKYEIDYTGKVTSTKVMSGIGYGCDEEAKRIVSLLVFKIPKIPRKLKVKFHKTIRIHFKIPKKKVKSQETKDTANQQMQIQYNITTTPKPKEDKKPSTGYTYTINY